MQLIPRLLCAYRVFAKGLWVILRHLVNIFSRLLHVRVNLCTLSRLHGQGSQGTSVYWMLFKFIYQVLSTSWKQITRYPGVGFLQSMNQERFWGTVWYTHESAKFMFSIEHYVDPCEATSSVRMSLLAGIVNKHVIGSAIVFCSFPLTFMITQRENVVWTTPVCN